LLIDERDNMDLTAVVAIAEVDFGEVLLAENQVAPARTAQRRGAALIAAALAHDDTVTLWHNYRDRAVLLEAALASQSGEHRHALQLDQEILQRLETSADIRPNTEPFSLLQRFRLKTGDDLSALGRRDEAREQWSTIVHSLPGPIETYDPELLVVLSAADVRLGRAEAAQDIAKRLRILSGRAGGE
jgi:hypothetical protein